MEAILKRVLSLEESEFDKQCGRGVALFEGFYAFLEEADKKGRAIDVLRKHRDNVDALLNDCHDTPQDTFFFRIAEFLHMVVCFIEQLPGWTGKHWNNCRAGQKHCVWIKLLAGSS